MARLSKDTIVKILGASRPDQITYLDAAGDNTPAVTEAAKRHIHHWNYAAIAFAKALGVTDETAFLRECEQAYFEGGK